MLSLVYDPASDLGATQRVYKIRAKAINWVDNRMMPIRAPHANDASRNSLRTRPPPNAFVSWTVAPQARRMSFVLHLVSDRRSNVPPGAPRPSSSISGQLRLSPSEHTPINVVPKPHYSATAVLNISGYAQDMPHIERLGGFY